MAHEFGLKRFPTVNTAFRKYGYGAFCWVQSDRPGISCLILCLPGDDTSPALHAFYCKRQTGNGGDINDWEHYWAWNGDKDKPILRNSLHWDGGNGKDSYGYVNGDFLSPTKSPNSSITSEMLR